MNRLRPLLRVATECAELGPSLTSQLLCGSSHSPLWSHGAASVAWERSLSTSASTSAPYQFQTVYKPPSRRPQPALLSRTNLELWKQSRYDVGVAEQLLQQQLQKRAAQEREASRRIFSLVQQAQNASELQLVVKGLLPAMPPSLLAATIHRASQVSSPSSHAATQQLLASLLDALQSHLSELKTWEVSLLLGAALRSGYQLDEAVAEGLVQVLLASEGRSVLQADAQTISRLMHACVHMRLPHGQQMWDLLSRAASAQLPTMPPAMTATVLKAAAIKRDSGNPLWHQAVPLIQERMQEWMKTPDVLAAAVRSFASVSGLGPEGQQLMWMAVAALSGKSAVVRLQPQGLADLGYVGSWMVGQGSGEGREVLRVVCEASAHRILRFTPSQLRLLMSSLITAQHREVTLIKLVSELLALRQFKGQESEGPETTCHLLYCLAQLDADQDKPYRDLAGPAIKALPRLSPAATSQLLAAYAHAGKAQQAAPELLQAAAASLARSVTTTTSTTATATAVRGLWAVCTLATASGTAVQRAVQGAVPPGAGAEVGRCVWTLADWLVAIDVKEVVAQDRGPQLLAALQAAGLNDHLLCAALQQAAKA